MALILGKPDAIESLKHLLTGDRTIHNGDSHRFEERYLHVPCVIASNDIAMIAADAGLPLNVLAWPGLASAVELKRLGVRRLSAGSGLAQALYGIAISLAVDFLKNGDSEAIAASGIPYTEINELCSNEAMTKQMKLPDRVYHLAEAANLPLIQRNGLLSASKLLDLAGLTGADRDRLERSQRWAHTRLPNGVQIRDQRPMPPKALESCLVGLDPAEWYAAINSRVFFWLDLDRLNRQRAACEPRPQVVLAVDTAKLVAAYCEQIALAPINTGNARRRPARRGMVTFVPYPVWVESGWASEAAGRGFPERKRSHCPVELTVADSVPDMMRFVIGVCELAPGQPFAPLGT
ncbi:isocitrate lyase/phosphoenolpyruvate mutase family protein [Chroococcidiopsis sp. CCMEE 29]|uniref:isocitrate lyase/phosphoenolpyruvate mutase family protein n=1 Tax=Chroococcidiopsis sp. CCMEE 29 TaxID=155894 RepID=UPI002021A5DF|nr:isocitrate lyase/phosphoenolpyruvate mutase family protein [Chroococcidiopsis sp. CCMEE 29]